MTLQNSYIFLSNPYKKEKKKENRTPDGAIILEVGKNVYSYISTAFPNLTKDKESSNLFRREYGCSVQVGTDCCEVKFIINEVVDITYLDVVAEGKTKAQIIKCLEQVQDTLLSSGIQDKYVNIISYDAISEYYCNKISPKLNALERNLRKLLFNIYIVNFGREYYQATISKELQDKIKGVIKAKGSEEKKEIERLQQFFYSFEFNDIQKLLFAPSWTDIDEQAKNSFLEKHNDLSQLSDEELREAFSKFTPKSDWERFFSNKINIADIEDMIEKIRQHRNSIAHFKFFYKEAYTESNKLISQLNAAVLKAIKITEDKDFAEKNAEYLRNAMSEVFKSFEEFRKNIAKVMTNVVIPTLRTIKTVVPPVLEQIRQTYQSFDFSGIKQALLAQQDAFQNFHHELPEHNDEDLEEPDAEMDGITESTSDEREKDEDI